MFSVLSLVQYTLDYSSCQISGVASGVVRLGTEAA